MIHIGHGLHLLATLGSFSNGWSYVAATHKFSPSEPGIGSLANSSHQRFFLRMAAPHVRVLRLPSSSQVPDLDYSTSSFSHCRASLTLSRPTVPLFGVSVEKTEMQHRRNYAVHILRVHQISNLRRIFNYPVLHLKLRSPHLLYSATQASPPEP